MNKKKLDMRCARLFKARHGRNPARNDIDKHCLPQTQEEAEWLSSMPEDAFAAMLSCWGITIRQFMADVA